MSFTTSEREAGVLQSVDIAVVFAAAMRDEQVGGWTPSQGFPLDWAAGDSYRGKKP